MTYYSSVSGAGAAPQKTEILVCMTACNCLYTCKHTAAGKAMHTPHNIPQVLYLGPALGSGNTLGSSWYFLVVPEIARTLLKLSLVGSCSQKVVFVKSETGLFGAAGISAPLCGLCVSKNHFQVKFIFQLALNKFK